MTVVLYPQYDHLHKGYKVSTVNWQPLITFQNILTKHVLAGQEEKYKLNIQDILLDFIPGTGGLRARQGIRRQSRLSQKHGFIRSHLSSAGLEKNRKT